MLYHPFISIVKEYEKICIVLNNRSSKRNKSDFDWRYVLRGLFFIWCNDLYFLLFRCTNISFLVNWIPFSHKNKKFWIQLLMLIHEMQYINIISNKFRWSLHSTEIYLYVVNKLFRLYLDKVWYWHKTFIFGLFTSNCSHNQSVDTNKEI